MECTMIQNNEKSMSYPEPLFVLSLYFNTIQNEKMYEKNVQIHLITSVIKAFEFDIINTIRMNIMMKRFILLVI